MDTYRAAKDLTKALAAGKEALAKYRRIPQYARAKRCCWARAGRRKKQSRFCARSSAE